jgi:hypothetical protein
VLLVLRVSLVTACSSTVRHLSSDPVKGDPVPQLEIEVRAGTHVSVDESMFVSWSGRRYIDGAEHHGPVHYLDPENTLDRIVSAPAKNVRVCGCEKCSA